MLILGEESQVSVKTSCIKEKVDVKLAETVKKNT